jgi:hypothetical protein
MMNYINNVREEFATVDLLLPSKTFTGRTDAFILAWVKVEKQIRRIVTYLLYQFPAFCSKDDIVRIIASSRSLYFDNFVRGFDALYRTPFDNIIGSSYAEFMENFARIRTYRNKILHGQLTGLALDAEQLQTEVELMRQWVTLVAEKMFAEIGYDGVAPNAFRKSHFKNFPTRYKLDLRDARDLEHFVRHSMVS